MIEVREKLIERWLPLRALSIDASFEQSFKPKYGILREKLGMNRKGNNYDPKLRSIHTWFARRPCGTARSLNLASILPSQIDEKVFERILGLSRIKFNQKFPPLLFYTEPDKSLLSSVLTRFGERPEQITVVDPMAGGGAIPLESLRLGFKTIAADYNPVAFLILRATLEFPAKYADAGLFEKTLTEAKAMINWARENLAKYYGSDAENYIFARGVRCSHCDGLVPVTGFGSKITDRSYAGRYLRLKFDDKTKRFTAECTSEKVEGWLKKAGKSIVRTKCPYCGKFFALRGRGTDHAFAKWFKEHAEIMEGIIERYTPAADVVDEVIDLHIPLIKQVKDGFIAISDDKEERSRFTNALERLVEEVQEGELSNFVPVDEIPQSNLWASTARALGLTKWYMLYNPRQLYVLSKLAEYVARRAEDLINKEGELGAAVATYLAFAIDKLADYNTIATHWQGTRFKTGIAHTLRGESTIDFRNEYVEMVVTVPKRSLEWALESDVAESGKLTRTAGGILPVLKTLCDWFRGASLGDRIDVYLADATKLSSLLAEPVDVINVDPPYFEQVVYSDKIEFLWVILRRALWPALDLLFRDRIKIDWNPKGPKGSELPRSRELVVRGKTRAELKEGDPQVQNFKRLFSELCAEFRKSLKEEGVLVLWFTHPSDLAWKCVGEALYQAGFTVSKVYPIISEMPTRYKKQVNRIAQQISLAIVARKGIRERLTGISEDVKSSLAMNERFSSLAEELASETLSMARDVLLNSVDAFALTFGAAMSIATRFEIPFRVPFEDLYSPAITCVISKFISNVLSELLLGRGEFKLSNEDANAVVKRIQEIMLRDPATRAYVNLLLASRVDISTGQPFNKKDKVSAIPSLDFDFAQTVSKICGFDIDKLENCGLIREEESDGKAYKPVIFEPLLAETATVPLGTLLVTIPGKAIYTTYLAIREIGTPQTKAKIIKEKLRESLRQELTKSEFCDIAALSLLLLAVTTDHEIVIAHGQQVLAPMARSGAIATIRELMNLE
jgi:adenine-specific DNA methylase